MKYFVATIVFVIAAVMVQAQTNNPTFFTYKQKQLNDTLQMLFPDLQTGKEVPLQENMPVLPLKNEGVKIGSNSLGDLYSMNLDNMPCLKPYTIKNEMPNAMKLQQLQPVSPLVPGEKK